MPPEMTTEQGREGINGSLGKKFVQFLIASWIEVRQICFKWNRESDWIRVQKSNLDQQQPVLDPVPEMG